MVDIVVVMMMLVVMVILMVLIVEMVVLTISVQEGAVGAGHHSKWQRNRWEKGEMEKIEKKNEKQNDSFKYQGIMADFLSFFQKKRMAPLRQFLKNYERDYFHTFFQSATRQYNHSKL